MHPVQFLEDSLARRWKSFRKQVRKGIPRGGCREIDEAVHDLRTTSRRFLSVLDAVERLGPRKPARRMARRVDRILKRLGRLRDLAVEREMLSRVKARPGRSGLRSIGRALERDFRRVADKARRRLRGENLTALKEDERRIVRRLRKRGAEGHDSDARQKVVDAIRAAWVSLAACRAAVDPTRVDTLHKMRIALKEFRYLLEALKPLAPGASEDRLEALHALQTTLGDLHDLEVLSASVAKHAEKERPEPSAEPTPVLAELAAEHSRILQSVLTSADAILAYWDEVLSPAPLAASRG